MEITFRTDRSIKSGHALIIAECGSASALWNVDADGEAEIDANDTDACPATADGCWPEPPNEIVEQARVLAGDEA